MGNRLDDDALIGDCDPAAVGNAAHSQVQLDVFGEVMDALHQARRGRQGRACDRDCQRALVGNLPQACSHVALVNMAPNLAHVRKPAAQPAGS